MYLPEAARKRRCRFARPATGLICSGFGQKSIWDVVDRNEPSSTTLLSAREQRFDRFFRWRHRRRRCYGFVARAVSVSLEEIISRGRLRLREMLLRLLFRAGRGGGRMRCFYGRTVGC
jgi:hypothetical protein